MAHGTTVLGNPMRGNVGGVVGREMYGQQVWQGRPLKGTQHTTERMREWRSRQAVNLPWLAEQYPLYKMWAVDHTRAVNMWTQWMQPNMGQAAWFADRWDWRGWFSVLQWEWDTSWNMDGLNMQMFDNYNWDMDWQNCWNIPWQGGGWIWCCSWSKNPVHPGGTYCLRQLDASTGTSPVSFDYEQEPPFAVAVCYQENEWTPAAKLEWKWL